MPANTARNDSCGITNASDRGDKVPRQVARLHSPLSTLPVTPRLAAVGYSFADQALAVGGGVLVNVVLARTQTKEEYGMFALSYSVFMFFFSLYHAAILEAYTVYGAGRYRERFSQYLRLIVRSNAVVVSLATGTLLFCSLLASWLAPQLMLRALLGLGLTVGVLLSSHLLRRTFYLQRQPALAAMTSFIFFVTVAFALWLAVKTHRLDSLSGYLILALGWITAGAVVGRELKFEKSKQHFLEVEPSYWREHWKYSRWVLATAFVSQFNTQGYYWLVAGFLSVREVGELRAMYNLIAPADQIFIALGYLVIPAMASHCARKRMDCLWSLWKRYALGILGVTALFALSLRIAGPRLMHLLYDGRFDGLGRLLFLLALLPLLMATGTTMAQALNAAEKPKLVFYGFLSSGAATFMLGIPLVIHFGLRGAVYGMLGSGATFSMVVGVGFLFAVYNKVLKETVDPGLLSVAAVELESFGERKI